MSITTLPSAELFRTMPATRDVQGVDRETNRILGAAVMQLGAVNDARPWDIDEDALASVVALGNQNPKGVKARFTHPNMSGDGLGTYLGRWTNFRREGDAVRADLALADVAFRSPKGDLGTYVLDLAEEDPEAFGNSAALRLDLKAMDKLKKDGRTKLRLQGLKAFDVVDDPASTRTGMFSVDLDDPRDIPAVVTQFLDTHFGGATPDVIRGRLDGLLTRYFDLRGLSMADHRTGEKDPTTEPQPQPAPEPKPADNPAPEPGPPQKADFSAELAAERQRVKAIHAVCGMAKVPQTKVNEFIDSGADLSTVNLFCAGHLSATNAPVPADPEPGTDDPDAKFKAEYRQHVELCKKVGLPGCTEAEYLRTRRIDAGELTVSDKL